MQKIKPNVFNGQDISANEFFDSHWQKSPCLLKNTTVDLTCLPDINTLFDLANHEGVQSRIVFTEDEQHYQAIYDEPEAWQEITHLKPTLLVSDIEKWFPQAMQLMDWFPFIKSWRFDDLMMSYAPKGSSVGAHTDHYDVFLVQIQGSRQWSYDDQALAHAEMVEDSELAVIKNYQPQHTAELKAGDILYLPPEIPHHGISTSDDCVTCSIGLRAPSNSELLTAITELATAHMHAQARFKDAVDTSPADASIGTHEINYLRQQLQQLAQASDHELAALFGQFITGYRLFDESPEIKVANNQVSYQKSPFAVFAYYKTDDSKANLFVNGECFCTSLAMARTLCDQKTFQLNELKKLALDPMNELRIFHHLIDSGAIQ